MRISAPFEQVLRSLRTSSKGAENLFKTFGEQVHFFGGGFSHTKPPRLEIGKWRMGRRIFSHQSSVFKAREKEWHGRAPALPCRAVGIGLPERSEPEGPQGTAKAQSLWELGGE